MSLHSMAGAEPSVWEAMQTTSTTAKIVAFKINRDTVLVTYTIKDQPQRISTEFCSESAAAAYLPRQNLSPEQRAAFFREQMLNIREAEKTGKPVELESTQPWSPCLLSVNLLSKG